MLPIPVCNVRTCALALRLLRPALALGPVLSQEDEAAVGSRRADVPLSRSRATLVVAAVSLVKQWKTEAAKHAPKLKVVVYHGAQRHKVRRRSLLTADLVITT